MANHGPVYGLDSELESKNKSKYDVALERDVKQWIKEVTGEDAVFSVSDAGNLKSGVLLCNLINKIKPNSVTKINKGTMPFVQMENIEAYLRGVKAFGLQTHELFQTVDLFEAKNMTTVLISLGALYTKATGKRGGSSGPSSNAFGRD